MSKPKVVVRRFKCEGAYDDCPSFGFEVLQVKDVDGVSKHDMLLGDGLSRLKNRNVKVVVI